MRTDEMKATRKRVQEISARVSAQHPGRLAKTHETDDGFLRSLKMIGVVSGLCMVLMTCVLTLHAWELRSWRPEVPEAYVIQPTEDTDQLVVAEEKPPVEWAVYTDRDLPIEPALNAVSYNYYLDCSEQDFLMVIRAADGISRHDQVRVKVGDILYVHTYVRNASNAAVAEGVRISGFFAPEVAAGETGEIGVTLSADNAEFSTIYNEVEILADADVRLEYIPGSLIVSTSGSLNGHELSEKELFSDNGLLLGYDQQDGVLPGGIDHALEIVYYLRVAAVDDPQTVEDFFEDFSHPESVMLAAQ